MNAGPAFTYFGSKWGKANLYPAPLYETIIEPFAGAAGYSLRYLERNVILCDKNPRIVGIWDFLINARPSEVLALPDIRDGETVDSHDIPEPAKWLIGYWLAPYCSRPMRKPSSWMLAGHRPNQYWGESVRQRLAYYCERIKHWRVMHGDFAHIENRRATWFIDPPYQNTRLDAYHTKPDFALLGQWCTSRQGQTIVCEQSGATWLPFEPLYNVPTRRRATRTGKQRNHEVIYANP